MKAPILARRRPGAPGLLRPGGRPTPASASSGRHLQLLGLVDRPGSARPQCSRRPLGHGPNPRHPAAARARRGCRGRFRRHVRCRRSARRLVPDRERATLEPGRPGRFDPAFGMDQRPFRRLSAGDRQGLRRARSRFARRRHILGRGWRAYPVRLPQSDRLPRRVGAPDRRRPGRPRAPGLGAGICGLQETTCDGVQGDLIDYDNLPRY